MPPCLWLFNMCGRKWDFKTPTERKERNRGRERERQRNLGWDVAAKNQKGKKRECLPELLFRWVLALRRKRGVGVGVQGRESEINSSMCSSVACRCNPTALGGCICMFCMCSSWKWTVSVTTTKKNKKEEEVEPASHEGFWLKTRVHKPLRRSPLSAKQLISYKLCQGTST